MERGDRVLDAYIFAVRVKQGLQIIELNQHVVSEVASLFDILRPGGFSPGSFVVEFVAHVLWYEDLENPDPAMTLKKILIVLDSHDYDPIGSRYQVRKYVQC